MAELFIITAGRDRGKTTTALKVAEILKERIEALVTVSHDGKESLYLRRLSTGGEMLLMSKNEDLGSEGGLIYSFSEETFRAAEEIIENTDRPYIMIDEVGRLDARGRGFARALDTALERAGKVIICTRRDFIPAVTERFGNGKYTLLDVDGGAVAWAEEERRRWN